MNRLNTGNNTRKKSNTKSKTNTRSDYLNSVVIVGTNSSSIKLRLVQSLLNSLQIQTFTDSKDIIQSAIASLYPIGECNDTSKEWLPCIHSCQSIVSKMVTMEIESTAYILRTLSNSIISADNSTIQFSVTGELTGHWSNDSQYINIMQIGNESQNSRLLLGLGPSASGKTYWAKSIIEIFSNSSPTFPKTFLSIDGGLYRETSIIYQYILEEIKLFCMNGIDNLVVSSWLSGKKSLFDAGIIKSIIISYLKIQKENIPISLYVPETFGDCGDSRLKACISKIKPYIDITGDHQWICLLIWQHKFASECPFNPPYTCVGCTESGKKREIKEGKKYSNSAYKHSMIEGQKMLLKAPGGQYNIHNCGYYDGISSIEDYTLYDSTKNLTIQTTLRDSNTMNHYKYRYYTPDQRNYTTRHINNY